MGAPDFRVGGKIFAQEPNEAGGWAIVKLTLPQQEMLCAAEPDLFKPEPSYWGSRGWTRLAVDAVDPTTARDVLWKAWRNVAPKSLARLHGPSASGIA
jgi:hypothetical protein